MHLYGSVCGAAVWYKLLPSCRGSSEAGVSQSWRRSFGGACKTPCEGSPRAALGSYEASPVHTSLLLPLVRSRVLVGRRGFQDLPAALPASLLALGFFTPDTCLETELAMAKGTTANTASKKRKKADTGNFKTYIARVLRQVHPKIRVSQKSMSILNSLVTRAA